MRNYLIIITLVVHVLLQAQENKPIMVNDSVPPVDYYQIAIQPTKATFYSAIVPGLGQAYNKDYWKIPIIYGALGVGVYSYSFNNTKYHEYRDAYKLMKMGQPTDYDYLSPSVLERAQKYHKKYRDLSIMGTVAVYLLQIVEASVDAHLQYHNTEPDLSVHPAVIPHQFSDDKAFGLHIQYRF